jgi:hypothetical protein
MWILTISDYSRGSGRAGTYSSGRCARRREDSDAAIHRLGCKGYTALINYGTGSMRLELLREMGANMPSGGGVPFTGELSQDGTLGILLYQRLNAQWNAAGSE